MFGFQVTIVSITGGNVLNLLTYQAFFPSEPHKPEPSSHASFRRCFPHTQMSSTLKEPPVSDGPRPKLIIS